MTGAPIAATTARKTPLRKCVAGGGVHPKGEMMRFVAGPDGNVWLDISGKLPARAAYVLYGGGRLEKAVQKRLLNRALDATCPPTLVADVHTALLKQGLDLLGLLARGRQVATGTDRVYDMLKAHGAGALVLATDAGANADKVRTLAEKTGVPVLAFAPNAALSAALGRENCVTIALLTGERTAKAAPILARISEELKQK